MIIVDRALRARAEAGTPIRVGMVGAGAMGRAVASQIINSTVGMELVAIANRHVDNARLAYECAGVTTAELVNSAASLESAIEGGRAAVTDDAAMLCGAPLVDVVLEVTGSVDHAARTVTAAIAHGKHVVLMNAELEATLGPILKVHADRRGVLLSGCDGDQPGVQLNLYRFVQGIGLTPRVCGNIKGLHDRYRTPTTQEGFARQWGLSPQMATSFADGTKISFEQATVANATGMGVACRGMLGLEFRGHVDELCQHYDLAELRACGGVVDFVVGAQPAPGVFVLASHDDPRQRRFLQLYKRGEGPLYSFYTPYHLCHFEVPLSIARVVLFHDAVTAPIGAPVVHVVAAAKRGLGRGEVLDGIGSFMTYGVCENAHVVLKDRLLPVGLAEGCRLLRDIGRDEVLTYADVELPTGRFADRLWAEQAAYFERIAA